MSDLSIPGVSSSKYGSDKLVADLMKLERVPRDKAEERLKSYQAQREVWLDLNRRLGTLRDEARNLYSFKNPFSARVAKSSNEDALTATATREAVEQDVQVLVKRAAAADRYLSADQPKDKKVPAGTYAFTVGEKSLELRYAGGSLQDFADALSRKGKDLLKASVISVTPETRALLVESLKTGSANKLSFSGAAEDLALETGMLERISSKARDFDPSRPQAWERPLTAAVRAEGGKLRVESQGEARLPLPQTVADQGMVLELRYRVERLPETPRPERPSGPAAEASGSVSYQGITLSGAPLASGLEEWAPPPEPPRVDDPVMLFAIGGGSTRALPALSDSGQEESLRVPLSELGGELSALGLRNRDTGRRLELLSARVFDPNERGGLRPKRAISSAQDALVAVDGIEVERPSNEISDLVPGVTLQVKEATEKPVKLKIEPDREGAKEAVIAFVGNYNRLMAQLNILSRNDEKLVQEISYFTDEEREGAKKNLGIFQGDSTVSLLRSSLQRSMQNAYPTGEDIRLLAQIGVATDARRPGSGQGYDVSRLRGYLEIEEETLNRVLESDFEAVRQLFGFDTDGDLVVDSGVGFTVDSAIKPYVETGGIMNLKTRTLDTQVTQERRTIETLDKQLIAKEADLKRKYGMMEGALNRMEGTSSSIDQFSKNNSGGQ